MATISSVPVPQPLLSTSTIQNPGQHPLLAPQRQSGVMQLYFLGSGQSLISPALSLLAELTLTPFFSLP